MAFQEGKEDATNGVHLTKHIYLLNTYARIYNQSNHARDGDKDTSKAKTLRPTIINNVVTYSFT